MLDKAIGNFKITRKIGVGGMGEVFAGTDLMLEREVAIKVLKPELAHDASIVARFRAEAVTLAKLSHPNIATVYAFVHDGDDYLLVMEFIRGWVLRDIIESHGPLPLATALAIFRQALDGIGYAHQQGIVHRDIKPSNFILAENGLLKVMDFGIARILGSARLTRTGRFLGTLEYMSPEQIRGESADSRSDIYSLGLLLYELLTGQAAFNDDSDYHVIKAQIETGPPLPSALRPDVPKDLEQILMRALAKDPGQRFQNVNEFAAAIALGSEQAGTQPASLQPLLSTLKESHSNPAASQPPTRLAAGAEHHPSTGANPAKTTRLAKEPSLASPQTQVLKWNFKGMLYPGILLAAALLLVPASYYLLSRTDGRSSRQSETASQALLPSLTRDRLPESAPNRSADRPSLPEASPPSLPGRGAALPAQGPGLPAAADTPATQDSPAPPVSATTRPLTGVYPPQSATESPAEPPAALSESPLTAYPPGEPAPALTLPDPAPPPQDSLSQIPSNLPVESSESPSMPPPTLSPAPISPPPPAEYSLPKPQEEPDISPPLAPPAQFTPGKPHSSGQGTGAAKKTPKPPKRIVRKEPKTEPPRVESRQKPSEPTDNWLIRSFREGSVNQGGFNSRE